ncbi:MAG TPA: P27 family phage terminase small subunit [Solirubrobacterales bacterium]|nr:P27 family phage terminase small subunit [Solirubrobacterales bacterium]
MPDRARPTAPRGLGKEGRKLWRQIQDAVAPDWELDERDERTLLAACQLEDRLAELDAAIAAEGLMVAGSRGQRVLHPAAQESRQVTLAQHKLLAGVELADPAAAHKREPMSSQRARRAAEARHGTRNGLQAVG